MNSSLQAPARGSKRITNYFLLLLSLVLFWAPIFFVNHTLLRRYSGFETNLITLQIALQNLRDKPVLFIGDSTTRSLHPGEPQINDDLLAGNISIEGTNASHWYYLLKKALRNSHPKIIVVGVSTISTTLDFDFPLDRYHVALLSMGDILSDVWESKISIRNALTLLQYIALPILHSRAEVMINLYEEYLPAIRPLKIEVFKDSFLRLPLQNSSKFIAQPQSQFERMLKLMEKTRAVFVLNPMGKRMRLHPEFSKNQGRFFELCQKYHLDCWNYAELYPMSAFTEDAIHLDAVNAQEYLLMLENRLARLLNAEGK